MDPIGSRSDAQALRSSASQQTLGQADFLRLLTTQLANQSPLDPMDNEAFVAQMAQFSAVSGIGEMNQSLQGLREDLGSRRLADAAAYIGRQAFVPAASVTLGTDGVDAVLDLAAPVDALAVEITDMAGKPVRSIVLGPRAAGEAAFAWDGKDAAGAPADGGPFRMRAVGVRSGAATEAPLYVAGRVGSVSTSGGALGLDIEGIGRLPPASIFKLT